MSPKQRRAYEEHVDTLRYQDDVLDTAREEGLAEGIVKGREEGLAEGIEKGIVKVARNMILAGIDNETISATIGLSATEVTALRKETARHSFSFQADEGCPVVRVCEPLLHHVATHGAK